MKYKDIKLEVKQVSEQGQFEGYAGAFGNVDLGGDMLMPGAFTKTISENSARPLLWAHDVSQPLGLAQLGEDAKGLSVNGQLNLDVQRAREIHSLMKQGVVKAMSFGYEAVTKSWRNGVRELKEVKLYEVSLLPMGIGMNPEAQVTSFKSIGDLEDALQIVMAYKCAEPLSPELKGLIEQVRQQLSALQAAQAPEAAKQDEIAPEVLHAASDRILKLIRGESRGD